MTPKIDSKDIMAPRSGVARGDMRFLAAAYGFALYRTGVECLRGHQSARRTATGECCACVARRHRKWKWKHPARAREQLNAHLSAIGKDTLPVL